MPCPPEIAETLTKILSTGLLRIRELGWSNNPARCALEADHLHNLPSLLVEYDADRLGYYWECERPTFIERSAPEDVHLFEPLWQALSLHMPTAKSRSLAG